MQQNPMIKEYLDITFRRKWWIILPALVGLLFAVALFFRFPKRYRAETRVAIRDQTISRDLLRPVIDFQHEELVTRISGEVTSEAYIHDLDQKLRLIGQEGGPTDPAELAKALGQAIDVQTNARDRYFTLKVVWGDARLAAAIANELAAIYIQRNQDIRKTMAGEAVEKLREKRENYEGQLADIREKISSFRAAHKFELESYQRTNEQQIDGNNIDIQRVNDRISQLRNLIQELELDRDQNVAGVGPNRDPRMDALDAKQSELRALLAKGYRKAHSERQQLEKEIASLKDALHAGGGGGDLPIDDASHKRYDLEIAQANASIVSLDEVRENLVEKNKIIKARLDETPVQQNELDRMLQREEGLITLYGEAFSQEAKALDGQTLEEFEAGEKFDVLNAARPPAKPFWPDLRLFLVMGLAVGAGLGVLVVLLLEVFDQSYKSEEQLAASIDYPILAVIPDLARAADRAKRRGKTRVRGRKAS